MNNYRSLVSDRALIITENSFLRLGLISCLRHMDSSGLREDVKNAVFIDVGSLRFISDLRVILNNAHTKGYSVILVCSGGEMSMVLGRLPHIDIKQSLSSWEEKINELLSPNLTTYYLKELNELLFLKKLGTIRLLIIIMINRGVNFNGIARKLSLTHKSLYRYIEGLTSYFNMKSSSFLFFFLKNRFPSTYFDLKAPEDFPKKIPASNSASAVC